MEPVVWLFFYKTLSTITDSINTFKNFLLKPASSLLKCKINDCSFAMKSLDAFQ